MNYLSKLSDIVLLLVVASFLWAIYFVVNREEPAIYQPVVAEKKSDPNDISTIETDSMEPTLPVGEKIVVDRKATPKVGDIVGFDCVQSREKGNCGLAYRYGTVHRLTAISPTGCMTIIGDNPKYDWSKVPSYMPEDIRIVGVVHKL